MVYFFQNRMTCLSYHKGGINMSTQTGDGSAVETQGHTPKRGTTPQGGNSIFIDQSERIVATIGSNYLQNFLAGGIVEKGVGILTQKRFYYKGRNFSGAGKGTSSANQEGVEHIPAHSK